MCILHRNACTYSRSLEVTTVAQCELKHSKICELCGSMWIMSLLQRTMKGKCPKHRAAHNQRQIYFTGKGQVQADWWDAYSGWSPKMCECFKYTSISLKGELHSHKPFASCLIKWPQRTSVGPVDASEKGVKEISVSKICQVLSLDWILLWGRIKATQQWKAKIC